MSIRGMNFVKQQDIRSLLVLISENLSVAHFWCSSGEKIVYTLESLSGLLREDGIVLDSHILSIFDVSRIVRDECDGWKVDVFSGKDVLFLASNDRDNLSDILVRSLNYCDKCNVVYYERKKQFLNEKNMKFFLDVDVKRMKVGLKDDSTLLFVLEVLNYNWDVLKDKLVRELWYARMYDLVKTRKFRKSITFSLLLLSLNFDKKGMFFKFVVNNCYVLMRKTELFFHSGISEWEFLLNVYQDFLFYGLKSDFKEDGILDFIFVYLGIEGSYYDQKIVKLLIEHYENVNSEATKFKIFKICMLFCSRNSVHASFKGIFEDIVSTDYFRTACSKDYSIYNSDVMLFDSDVHLILNSFPIYSDLGIESILYPFFNRITNEDFKFKFFTDLSKNHIKINDLRFLILGYDYFHEIFVYYYGRNIVNDSRFTLEISKFTRRLVQKTINLTFESFEKEYYNELYFLFSKWNRSLTEILSVLQDQPQLNSKYYVNFFDFLSFFFYSLEDIFKVKISKLYDIFIKFKDNFRELMSCTAFSDLLNRENSVYYYFLMRKSEPYRYSGVESRIIQKISKFHYKYNILVPNFEYILSTMCSDSSFYEINLLESLFYFLTVIETKIFVISLLYKMLKVFLKDFDEVSRSRLVDKLRFYNDNDLEPIIEIINSYKKFADLNQSQFDNMFNEIIKKQELDIKDEYNKEESTKNEVLELDIKDEYDKEESTKNEGLELDIKDEYDKEESTKNEGLEYDNKDEYNKKDGTNIQSIELGIKDECDKKDSTKIKGLEFDINDEYKSEDNMKIKSLESDNKEDNTKNKNLFGMNNRIITKNDQNSVLNKQDSAVHDKYSVMNNHVLVEDIRNNIDLYKDILNGKSLSKYHNNDPRSNQTLYKDLLNNKNQDKKLDKTAIGENNRDNVIQKGNGSTNNSIKDVNNYSKSVKKILSIKNIVIDNKKDSIIDKKRSSSINNVNIKNLLNNHVTKKEIQGFLENDPKDIYLLEEKQSFLENNKKDVNKLEKDIKDRVKDISEGEKQNFLANNSKDVNLFEKNIKNRVRNIGKDVFVTKQNNVKGNHVNEIEKNNTSKIKKLFFENNNVDNTTNDIDDVIEKRVYDNVTFNNISYNLNKVSNNTIESNISNKGLDGGKYNTYDKHFINNRKNTTKDDSFFDKDILKNNVFLTQERGNAFFNDEYDNCTETKEGYYEDKIYGMPCTEDQDFYKIKPDQAPMHDQTELNNLKTHKFMKKDHSAFNNSIDDYKIKPDQVPMHDQTELNNLNTHKFIKKDYSTFNNSIDDYKIKVISERISINKNQKQKDLEHCKSIYKNGQIINKDNLNSFNNIFLKKNNSFEKLNNHGTLQFEKNNGVENNEMDEKEESFESSDVKEIYSDLIKKHTNKTLLESSSSIEKIKNLQRDSYNDELKIIRNKKTHIAPFMFNGTENDSFVENSKNKSEDNDNILENRNLTEIKKTENEYNDITSENIRFTNKHESIKNDIENDNIMSYRRMKSIYEDNNKFLKNKKMNNKFEHINYVLENNERNSTNGNNNVFNNDLESDNIIVNEESNMKCKDTNNKLYNVREKRNGIDFDIELKNDDKFVIDNVTDTDNVNFNKEITNTSNNRTNYIPKKGSLDINKSESEHRNNLIANNSNIEIDEIVYKPFVQKQIKRRQNDGKAVDDRFNNGCSKKVKVNNNFNTQLSKNSSDLENKKIKYSHSDSLHNPDKSNSDNITDIYNISKQVTDSINNIDFKVKEQAINHTTNIFDDKKYNSNIPFITKGNYNVNNIGNKIDYTKNNIFKNYTDNNNIFKDHEKSTIKNHTNPFFNFKSKTDSSNLNQQKLFRYNENELITNGIGKRDSIDNQKHHYQTMNYSINTEIEKDFKNQNNNSKIETPYAINSPNPKITNNFTNQKSNSKIETPHTFNSFYPKITNNFTDQKSNNKIETPHTFNSFYPKITNNFTDQKSNNKIETPHTFNSLNSNIANNFTNQSRNNKIETPHTFNSLDPNIANNFTNKNSNDRNKNNPHENLLEKDFRNIYNGQTKNDNYEIYQSQIKNNDYKNVLENDFINQNINARNKNIDYKNNMGQIKNYTLKNPLIDMHIKNNEGHKYINTINQNAQMNKTAIENLPDNYFLRNQEFESQKNYDLYSKISTGWLNSSPLQKQALETKKTISILDAMKENQELYRQKIGTLSVEHNLMRPRKNQILIRANPDFDTFFAHVLTEPSKQTTPTIKNFNRFTFENFDDYYSYFFPLITGEVRTCIINATRIKNKISKNEMTVTNITKGQVLTEIELQAQYYEGLQSNDCIILKEVNFDASKIPRSFLCIIKETRSTKNISIILAVCKPGIITPLKHDKFFYTSVASLNTFYREYQAIFNLQTLTFKQFIISPQKFNHILKADEQIITNLQEKLNVNLHQAIAIESCINFNKKIVLIQGPPGTGKTTTICSILSALYSGLIDLGRVEGKSKILICAPSNLAIDTIAKKILKGIKLMNEIKYYPKILRVGVVTSISDELKKITLDYLVESDKTKTNSINKNLRKIELLNNTEIVCSTLNASVTENIFIEGNSYSFDLIIVDEACQSVELSTIIPFKYNPRKIILIGDPQQLPPTVVSNNNKYEVSLFERLSKFIPVTLLREQYRMNKEIVAFPSKAFYLDKLITNKEMNNRYNPFRKILPLGTYFIDIDGKEECSENNSYCNIKEAEVVVELVFVMLNYLKNKFDKKNNQNENRNSSKKHRNFDNNEIENRFKTSKNEDNVDELRKKQGGAKKSKAKFTEDYNDEFRKTDEDNKKSKEKIAEDYNDDFRRTNEDTKKSKAKFTEYNDSELIKKDRDNKKSIVKFTEYNDSELRKKDEDTKKSKAKFTEDNDNEIRKTDEDNKVNSNPNNMEISDFNENSKVAHHIDQLGKNDVNIQKIDNFNKELRKSNKNFKLQDNNNKSKFERSKTKEAIEENTNNIDHTTNKILNRNTDNKIKSTSVEMYGNETFYIEKSDTIKDINNDSKKITEVIENHNENTKIYDFKHKRNQKTSIAVISPYKNQISIILTLYKNKYSQNLQDLIDINTVDAFQGQEKDFVIISAVRTNKIGFVSDHRRLNVALTRARFGVVVCGNKPLLSLDKIWDRLISFYSENGCSTDMDGFFNELKRNINTTKI